MSVSLPFFSFPHRCRFFFFSSRRRHTRLVGDWSSDVCSSDLRPPVECPAHTARGGTGGCGSHRSRPEDWSRSSLSLVRASTVEPWSIRRCPPHPCYNLRRATGTPTAPPGRKLPW